MSEFIEPILICDLPSTGRELDAFDERHLPSPDEAVPFLNNARVALAEGMTTEGRKRRR
jgi:hypothetical protein